MTLYGKTLEFKYFIGTSEEIKKQKKRIKLTIVEEVNINSVYKERRKGLNKVMYSPRFGDQPKGSTRAEINQRYQKKFTAMVTFVSGQK